MRPYTCLLLLFILSVNPACIKLGGRCEEPIDVYQSNIQLAIMDRATGQYIYSNDDPLYDVNDLVVEDDQGRALTVQTREEQDQANQLEIFDMVIFRPIFLEGDENAFSAEKCRTYYLHYSATESDTLRACFRAKKTKCGSIFSSLTLYDSQSNIISSVSNNVSLITSFVK